MKTRPITPKDYELLLEHDKKIYPTPNPVTFKVLDRWYKKNPEFGVMFEENSKLVGVCIAIPLNYNGWKRLISGKLPESELGEKTIFNNKRDNEIGIHIYHIEKLNPSINHIYKASLKELHNLINNLRKDNPKLKIAGFSALSVTTQGINLFEDKLNCKERDYICSEYIFEKDGRLSIIDTTSQADIDNKLKEGYTYKNKCKMLVSYPNEESIIWEYLS